MFSLSDRNARVPGSARRTWSGVSSLVQGPWFEDQRRCAFLHVVRRAPLLGFQASDDRVDDLPPRDHPTVSP